MKEMIYSNIKNEKTKILYSGIYKGKYFCIINICGHHPCAYVEVKDESYFDWEDTSPAHYGFTFADSLSHIRSKVDASEISELDDAHLDNLFFGWDFAHIGDYTPTRLLSSLLSGNDNEDETDKKWTTQEIFENVKEVIDWINEEEFKHGK